MKRRNLWLEMPALCRPLAGHGADAMQRAVCRDAGGNLLTPAAETGDRVVYAFPALRVDCIAQGRAGTGSHGHSPFPKP